jgi:hypothetical protein
MASINLRNRRNELIYGHETDTKGAARVFLLKTGGIKYLTIGSINYERVYIPISKFKDVNCYLVVRLKHADMEIHPKKGTMH